MSHILIAGLGDLGSGLAQVLLAEGHRVSAIRRGQQCPAGVELYSQDLTEGAAMLPPDQVDLLVIIMTPSEYSEAGYLKAFVRAPLTLLDALAQQQPLPPVVFVSSSAVFGELAGEVDELTSPRPSRYNTTATHPDYGHPPSPYPPPAAASPAPPASRSPHSAAGPRSHRGGYG